MSHAHHFLERLDRVNREQTEFALSLYRDHEAIAYVLTHVNLPADADRVALAIETTPDGPMVLVTRDGRFVTCLGAGMHHSHPVVPRGQLDALLAKVADKRAKKELVQRELRPDEEEGDLLHRVLTRGSRLAREDFLVVSAFEPLLGAAPLMAMLDLGLDALKLRAALSVNGMNLVVNGKTKKSLEQLDHMEWAVAHLTVLSGAAERKALDKLLEYGKSIRTAATFPCSAQAGSTFYLRAAWMTARFGKGLIPAYKAAFGSLGDWMSILDAGMGLTAIALRHASTQGEIGRFLEGFGPRHEKPVTPDESRANIAHVMLDIMANAEERMASTIKVGQHFAVALSAHLPEGHPRRFATKEDVPDDLARTAALTFDGLVFDPQIQALMLTSLPTAARAAAEDFYYPRDIVRAWLGAWTPEETVARVQRWVAACAKPVPVKVAAPPGRNDPCSCGSGKKWKKCHGSVQA